MTKKFDDLNIDDYVEIIEKHTEKYGGLWAEESFIKAIKDERTIFNYRPLFDEVLIHNNQINDFDSFGTINPNMVSPRIDLNYVLYTRVFIYKYYVTFVFSKHIYSESFGWNDLTPGLASNTMLLSALSKFEKYFPHIKLPNSYQNLIILT